jgi:hypothetical protein
MTNMTIMDFFLNLFVDRYIYCEITFICGVPIFVVFVGRLIHEIKNPMNNETWEAVWHRYIGKCCPRVTSTLKWFHSIYIYPQTNLKKNSMMVIFYCDRGLTANHLLLIFFMTLYFHYCLTLTSALGSLIWLQVTKCAALLKDMNKIVS